MALVIAVRAATALPVTLPLVVGVTVACGPVAVNVPAAAVVEAVKLFTL